MIDVVASIVMYRNSSELLRDAINSFLNTSLNVKIVLVDNSPTDELKSLQVDERIEYIFLNDNVGFGAGHNIAIKQYVDKCDNFLVLNPDIYYKTGVLEKLVNRLEKDPEIGLIQPQVRYPDDSIQYLCKRNPTPFDLFARRFLPSFLKRFFKDRMDNYELHQFTYHKEIVNVPYLSGCFMLFRSSILKKVGYFDDRIFMYIEDADITRRTLEYAKTLYDPNAYVYHHFAKGSHKSFRLMSYSIHGAWVYFNKWGWFNNDPGEAYQKPQKISA